MSGIIKSKRMGKIIKISFIVFFLVTTLVAGTALFLKIIWEGLEIG